MAKANMDIREAARAASVCLWQISEEYRCTDSAPSQKLMHELDDTEKQKIFEIIDQFRRQQNNTQPLNPPRMLTIREAAQAGPLTEYALRLLLKQNNFVDVTAPWSFP